MRDRSVLIMLQRFPRAARPAPFLPIEVIEPVFENLDQFDRLALCRVCRPWYLAAYHLVFEALEFKLPIPGKLENHGDSKRWMAYKKMGVTPKILTIRDPVRQIHTYPDKLFDSLSRMSTKIPAIFPVDINLLHDIRELRIQSQLVNVCGRWYSGQGTSHAWAYDIVPHLLVRCPNLRILDVEISPVYYPWAKNTIGRDSLELPREHGVNPFLLCATKVIPVSEWDWAMVSQGEVTEYPRRMQRVRDQAANLLPPEDGLEQMTLTVSGRAHYTPRHVWRTLSEIFEALDLQQSLRELRISYTLEVVAGPRINWKSYTTLCSLGVKKLRLDFGETACLPPNTLAGIEWAFAAVESLCIDRYGLWTAEQLGYLDKNRRLKHLHVREREEKVTEDVEPEDLNISLEYQRALILFNCMEALLIPRTLQTIKWERFTVGYQEVLCTIKRHPKSCDIEHVDVWFMYNDRSAMEHERYDALHFHQELLYGIGKEERWGPRWAAAFGSENVSSTGIDIGEHPKPDEKPPGLYTHVAQQVDLDGDVPDMHDLAATLHAIEDYGN
ncbi:hypothetical protein Dda_8259 [Drechslerella dactyloides]|uniref:F-box domain-containing protein n=1 Tax=Drechslerella dactyloides TaxID=74499 RepID=A0AAD6ITI7_DREDA|nr:hypothetical protein Dda_8259 [Drechslerella dactyloides]